MAFSIGSGARAGRSRFRGTRTLAEINIVPLVDVGAGAAGDLHAHRARDGIRLEVDVPKVKQVKDTAQELPVVTITRSGNLYLNDQMININDLGTQVRKKFHGASSGCTCGRTGPIWDVDRPGG